MVDFADQDHDVLVSFVSHVPQLAASTLMDVATTHEAQHRALLRLAAGGFRDMTRLASGSPEMYAGIALTNADNLAAWLKRVETQLAKIRRHVEART